MFICKECNYSTSRKANLIRHNSTKKHKLVIENKKNIIKHGINNVNNINNNNNNINPDLNYLEKTFENNFKRRNR